MASTYYELELTDAEVEAALTAIDGVITPSNNGKILYINNGKIAAKSASEFAGATLEALSVTANGDYTPGTGVDGYDEVHVAVPNSYAAGDEGKVVSNGALVAQTARGSQITQNGTYDTTLNNSVEVNVSGSSPTLITKNISENGTYNASADSADGYSQVVVNVSGGGTPAAGNFRIGSNSNAGMIVYENRVLTNTGRHDYRCVYLSPADMEALALDPTKDFEIGCAFKLKDSSKTFTLFAEIGNASNYAAFPSIEIGVTLVIGRGIQLSSGSASSWGSWENFESGLSLDTWYFARVKYTAATHNLRAEITTDFTNYTGDDTTLEGNPMLNSSYGFGFGSFGTQTNRSTTAMIDMDNMYIKKENTIVFGKFTGEFPTNY